MLLDDPYSMITSLGTKYLYTLFASSIIRAYNGERETQELRMFARAGELLVHTHIHTSMITVIPTQINMYSTRSPNYYENVAQATVTTKMGRGSGRMGIGCTKTGIFQREEQNEGTIQAPHNRRLS